MSKQIFILGRQPNLGMAELEQILGSNYVSFFNESVAITDQPLIFNFIDKLGGCQKIADVLFELPTMEWTEIEKFIETNIVRQIVDLTDGKIKFGISAVGLNVQLNQINNFALKLKKLVKNQGRSIRVVPNKTLELSTAQVIHNQLISDTGFELNIITNKDSLILARTNSVQNINAYASRDQTRPNRDAKIGMLPLKLAQIMINIANPGIGSTILDPFCGTGVLLQEALLMGYNVIGTDIDERMVDYARANLNWLGENFNLNTNWKVETADATNTTWKNEITSVVGETYLGRPLSNLPRFEKLNEEINKVNSLIHAFLINIHSQIKPNTRLCLAVPAWVDFKGFQHLPILDRLEEIGYNLVSFKNVDTRELIYFRPDQIVARQLLLLNRI